MDILLNPNTIYLLIVAGLLLALLALAAPGTGILELVALGILAIAGYGIIASGLSINLWAIPVLAAGVVLFVLSLRNKRGRVLLIAAIVALIIGSTYILQSEIWWQPAVNPALATVVSVILGLAIWFVANQVIKAARSRPAHLEQLVNEIGEAKTPVQKEGSVYVAGELWSAYSDQPIPKGARVRVVAQEGFHVKVEMVDQA